MIYEKIVKLMKNDELSALIITDRYNMNYISKYMGDTGMLLFTGERKNVLTDSRYTEIAGKEAIGFECVDIGLNGYSKTISRLILNGLSAVDDTEYGNEQNEKESSANVHKIRIGFEDDDISYKQYKAFADEFESTFGRGVELVPMGGRVSALRQIKSEYELECIAMAEHIGDEAFAHICKFIKVGMTEKEIALELEVAMKKMGADGLSFDTIVASGVHSSMPHAVPTDKKVCVGDFITMDFGCIYKGYCSDMTRTVFVSGANESSSKNILQTTNADRSVATESVIENNNQNDEAESIIKNNSQNDVMKSIINENGETSRIMPSAKQLEIYNIVYKAQTESLKLIKPGAVCSEIDAFARKIIADAGYGEYFGHGLGHSVGLFIHEEPRLSRSCNAVLEEGMTITVEPGIYLPGEFGVRIEDLLVVTKDGYRNLASSEKKLVCV